MLRPLLLSLAAVVVVSAGAQQLEVASVRKNDSGSFQQALNVQPGGTLVVTNFPVGQLIPIAYRVQQSQVVNGPNWIATERYDIRAKATEGGPTRDILRTLLVSVLSEHFKLRVHHETREMPVYRLVMRNRNQLGPALRRVESGCGAPAAAPGEPAATRRCDMRLPPGRIIAVGADMAMLASSLGLRLGRPVIDRTGVTGWFDIDVEYEPETQGAPVASASLITALSEQLGLKVESDRAPMDVVVIDGIERPSDE